MTANIYVTTVLKMKELRNRKICSNLRYILTSISLILSGTALVPCTLSFHQKAKDSIHTDLEVEELKAELDSLQRENRILRAENSYLKGVHAKTNEKNYR